MQRHKPVTVVLQSREAAHALGCTPQRLYAEMYKLKRDGKLAFVLRTPAWHIEVLRLPRAPPPPAAADATAAATTVATTEDAVGGGAAAGPSAAHTAPPATALPLAARDEDAAGIEWLTQLVTARCREREVCAIEKLEFAYRTLRGAATAAMAVVVEPLVDPLGVSADARVAEESAGAATAVGATEADPTVAAAREATAHELSAQLSRTVDAYFRGDWSDDGAADAVLPLDDAARHERLLKGDALDAYRALVSATLAKKHDNERAERRGRDALLVDTLVISGRTVARIMLAISSRAFPRAEWRNSQWWGRRTTFSFDQIRAIADDAITEGGGRRRPEHRDERREPLSWASR